MTCLLFTEFEVGVFIALPDEPVTWGYCAVLNLYIYMCNCQKRHKTTYISRSVYFSHLTISISSILLQYGSVV